MFLSPLVSHLEPDGSLVVDLADERGPVLKFEPLAEGMPWSRLEGGQWVPTDHDYGLLLVNDAHDGRWGLPVSKYLADLPRDDIERVNRLRYVQATVLQLYARWPEARELLRVNPGLLWLVAERYFVDPGVRHRVSGMLLEPQRGLLEFVLGQSVRPAQVRFLQRLVLNTGDRATIAMVRQLVADATMVMRLRHWPRIPTGLLPLFIEAPAVAELNWLREDVAGADDDWTVGRIVEKRRRFVRDTVRMLGVLRRDGDESAMDVRRYPSWKSLKALHDRLITAARRAGWGSLLDAELPAAQVFPPPPIPSTERFDAIGSVAEVIKEAERMHHCVVTRAQDVMAGTCALYRVNVAGERATLELSLGRDGEPLAIDEFRLACNAEPSNAAWLAAQAWLAEGRKRWRERGGR